MDKTLCARVSDRMDIEELIEEFHDVMKSACDKPFRTRRPSKKAKSNKSVPSWTEEPTIMRKNVNALRRITKGRETAKNCENRAKHNFYKGKQGT